MGSDQGSHEDCDQDCEFMRLPEPGQMVARSTPLDQVVAVGGRLISGLARTVGEMEQYWTIASGMIYLFSV